MPELSRQKPRTSSQPLIPRTHLLILWYTPWKLTIGSLPFFFHLATEKLLSLLQTEALDLMEPFFFAVHLPMDKEQTQGRKKQDTDQHAGNEPKGRIGRSLLGRHRH